MPVQDDILSKYGPPGLVYQQQYCEMWNVHNEFNWFPAQRIFINKDFRIKLQSAFNNLDEVALHTEIKTFDGCYNERKVRGNAKLVSLHSWALAMDLNAHIEPLGQKTTHWTGDFIGVMKAAGIFWGGDFKRHDSMHWSLYPG